MKSTVAATVLMALGSMLEAQRPAGMQTKAGAPVAAAVAIEVVSLTATPASPQPGLDVTFTMTLRNAGTGFVAQVPWLIGLQGGNQPVGQGTISSFGPGATQTVTATWRAVAGNHALLGAVDPGGRTFANTAPVSVRARDLALNVPQVSGQMAGTGTVLETRVLDMNAARQAGATFADGGPVPCVTELQRPQSDRLSAYVRLICTAAGARVRMTAFDGFLLKNGWVVKRVEMGGANDGNRGWSWVERPQEGSNRPKAVLGMWASPLHLCGGA